MRRLAILLALGFGALLASRFALAREQSSQFYDDEGDMKPARDAPDYWFVPDEVKQYNYVLGVDMGPEQNILAVLALIREFESNNRYNVIYGGQTFASYADHPRIYVPINLPGYEGKTSSAAGAYQYLWKTWNNLRNRLGLPDFSPASQDAAAIELLREIGALSHIQAGNFDEGLRIASGQWASLPYSDARQNPKTIVAANEFLRRYLA